MIYQPHMEQSDWSKFTTMVQYELCICIITMQVVKEICFITTSDVSNAISIHYLATKVFKLIIAMHVEYWLP